MFIDREVSTSDNMTHESVRKQIDDIMKSLSDINQDTFYIRKTFVDLYKNRENIKEETISLIHNYQERQVGKHIIMLLWGLPIIMHMFGSCSCYFKNVDSFNNPMFCPGNNFFFIDFSFCYCFGEFVNSA